jgi:hypothetical protein
VYNNLSTGFWKERRKGLSPQLRTIRILKGEYNSKLNRVVTRMSRLSRAFVYWSTEILLSITTVTSILSMLEIKKIANTFNWLSSEHGNPAIPRV